MQDIHSVGGGGRLFSGGGGDRRLRPHHHQNQQALKCPRCDSLNTKFCYYNNYNLSQPRHFCKSCRRYWTKGGVLRNVPVGGGCRKTKRARSRLRDLLRDWKLHKLNYLYERAVANWIRGEEMKMQEMAGVLIDQTVHVELSALPSSGSGTGGFGPLDWQGTGDQGLFDLPNAVDQTYWSQSQWTDQDPPSLYLP
ncbi:hypothetical protein GH714_043274 [Hevea brasiliensis]|uniref:Dof zinc finger protein n=1 Tax=Hevea brasiliensis TaxID=3981 RepID=A0A6A6K2T3_HEVBR|nr:hypothetical protein GH714_043274 [Hevea brasiliensis]